MLTYIEEVDTTDTNLQTAVLLTGVNQTDHFKQFESLSQKIANNCYSVVSILKSRDCPNVKSAIETLVGGLINTKSCKRIIEDDENEESDEEMSSTNIKLKRKQLTLSVLQSWFWNQYKDSKHKPKIVIMLADFEQFNPLVMQDLVSIFCAYTSKLPLVLIMGIATAFKTLHNVLPFHITSKITANVFQAESATSMLNRILDEVILTHHCPFFLSGKSFNVLVDIFLFYDYSIHSFLQGFKVFMLEHYSSNMFSTINVSKGQISDEIIEKLTSEQCASIRKSCMTFRKHVEQEENPNMRIDLIESDDALKTLLISQMRRIYRFFFQFFCCLRMLSVLIDDLPRNKLGTLPRELYPMCAAEEVTKTGDFQECFKLLRFTSKDKFLLKLDKVIKILEDSLTDEHISDILKRNFSKVLISVKKHRTKIANAGMSPIKQDSTPKASTSVEISRVGTMGRQQMLEKLKESAKNNAPRVVIEFEKLLIECLDYLHQLFDRHLVPFSKGPTFIELFTFTDHSFVRRQIVGAPRGAIHNALSNPHHYLQCKCCELRDNEQILPTLPDIAIAYKLHLECNKFINLYDWLQAFSMVIDDNEDEDSVKAEIQYVLFMSFGL